MACTRSEGLNRESYCESTLAEQRRRFVTGLGNDAQYSCGLSPMVEDAILYNRDVGIAPTSSCRLVMLHFREEPASKRDAYFRHEERKK